jgi:lipopolysaccharide transport system ATP-binding protein
MDIAVRLKDVYKEYPFYQHITAGFKSFLLHLPRNISLSKRKNFTALNGISIEIEKGETFGIIGRNGSGKSTILSLIAGVIRQNRGVVKIDGKISSLLELGSGFHPDLSGIENIILNGILMGSTRERVLKKLDKIIEFSELEDFIYQPLRTYSSGMQMRLGFSVAVHIDPEILLIDEALAVGDLSFQEKCLEKMLAFKKSGATIIIVSHDMNSISKLCDRVLWINNGSIQAIGKPMDTIKRYMAYSFQGMDLTPTEEQLVVDRDGQLDSELSVTAQTSDNSISAVSWWDSPLVIKQCEDIITGNPDISFYDYLRNEYVSQSLEKGLSICNRLKGIESNFVEYNVCKSFDVIDDKKEIYNLIEGKADFKEEYYDLFLCVDLIHQTKNLDLFLKDIYSALKDKGFIIALEYVGPAEYQWSDKEMELADMFSEKLSDGKDISDFGEAAHISMSNSLAPATLTGEHSANDVIPMTERFFDIIKIRYFGGPFYNLLLNKVLDISDPNDKRVSTLIKTIIQVEQVLIQEESLNSHYALIIAKKKSGSSS